MPRNGSGVYGLPTGTTAVPNTPIESAKYNAVTSDLAQALTDSVNVQGTAPFQADQPMGNHKLTGLSAGAASTDSPTLAQVQSTIVAHAITVAGTPDAIALAFSPPFAAYAAKMRFRFTASGANTLSNPTVNVDGLGAKTIKKLNGQALTAGDIAGSGHIVDCVYDGANVMMLSVNAVPMASNTVAGLVKLATTAETRAVTDANRAITPAALGQTTRLKLTANTTLYVRKDGSDSNDGSANDASHAVLTISRAVAIAQGLDANGFMLIIQVGDGTYNESVLISQGVGIKDRSKLILRGNPLNPSNVIIAANGANAVKVEGAAHCTVTGIELRTTTSGNALFAADHSIVEVGAIRFGSCAGSQIYCLSKSIVYMTADYTIAGGGNAHYRAEQSSNILVSETITVSLTGTPGFGVFAIVLMDGLLKANNVTYSGNATGVRFAASELGKIKCGGSANYFPGNTAGVGTDFDTSPFGWYH